MSEEKTDNEDSGVLVCDDCGTTKDVSHTNCPYAEDVNNTIQPANLCPKCYTERVRDI